MKRTKRIWALCALCLAIGFFAVSLPTTVVFAKGSFSDTLEPGSTSVFKYQRHKRYVRGYGSIEFSNEGPGEACLAISSRGYSDEICIAAKDTIVLTEIFNGRVEIMNKSSTDLVKIQGTWLP